MTASEFLTTVSILLGLMGLLSLAERGLPLFARGERSEGRGFANWALTLTTLLFNWGLISFAAIVALALWVEGSGWMASLALPWPARIAITVAVLDLCTYLAHVTMHETPVLWRAHRVHHSDPFLDVTTTLRQHPIEGLWRFLWIIVPVWALGLPAADVAVYRLLSIANGILEHANIRVWRPFDRVLSLVWCTPNMHKVHHSRAMRETNSNYGNLFALFDRAFGTFTPTEKAFEVVYGLEGYGADIVKSVPGLMALPFAHRGIDPIRRELWGR